MQQAEDFLDESRALAEVLDPLDEQDFSRVTQFKGWTIDDVIGHLHMFNRAAGLTAESERAFEAFFTPMARELAAGRRLLDLQRDWLDGLCGRALLERWCTGCEETARRYAALDPKARLKWAGPAMSARSGITARQMETWAHGQAVFDLLGIERHEHDRIRNIAHLGVTTFAWTFLNRGEDVPEPPPHVVLTAPSGAILEWNPPQADNRVEGTACEFCQVVTQTRNVADTSLVATGAAAARWMSIAQCFAGPPEDPPAPGTRHTS